MAPDASKMTIDNLTGSGSILSDPSAVRLDALTRAQTYTTTVPVSNLNIQAEQQLRAMVPAP